MHCMMALTAKVDQTIRRRAGTKEKNGDSTPCGKKKKNKFLERGKFSSEKGETQDERKSSQDSNSTGTLRSALNGRTSSRKLVSRKELRHASKKYNSTIGEFRSQSGQGQRGNTTKGK